MKSNFSIGEGRVLVRSFDHKEIGGVTSAYAVGTHGSTSGLAVERKNTSKDTLFFGQYN